MSSPAICRSVSRQSDDRKSTFSILKAARHCIADGMDDHRSGPEKPSTVLKSNIVMNDSRTLFLSRDGKIRLAGIVMFVLSLVLPAAKMGSVPSYGIVWLIQGTILSLYPNGSEAASLSLLALIMNLGCIVSITASFHRRRYVMVDVLVALSCGFCAILLAVRPYSGFEQVYFGYYVWIGSAIVMAVVPVVLRCLVLHEMDATQ